MGREGRDYWEVQLSEYWASGLTIQEYSELKELGSGIWLQVGGIEIAVEKGFDSTTLFEVLDLLKVRLCSGSAAR